uniref:Uncharacterized protein n=1 Tax=uncultured marine virus TaxID=186617 RepID=A0A0F7L7W1_9VIRU|nr:hypothetical protein [uncultured marine virus]
MAHGPRALGLRGIGCRPTPEGEQALLATLPLALTWAMLARRSWGRLLLWLRVGSDKGPGGRPRPARVPRQFARLLWRGLRHAHHARLTR